MVVAQKITTVGRLLCLIGFMVEEYKLKPEEYRNYGTGGMERVRKKELIREKLH